jgi:hypothetical protein
MQIIETTPAQHIQYAYASVEAINAIIAAKTFDSNSLDALSRNMQHLQIISSQDYAAQFPSDVATFATAISNAQVTLASESAPTA